MRFIEKIRSMCMRSMHNVFLKHVSHIAHSSIVGMCSSPTALPSMHVRCTYPFCLTINKFSYNIKDIFPFLTSIMQKGVGRGGGDNSNLKELSVQHDSNSQKVTSILIYYGSTLLLSYFTQLSNPHNYKVCDAQPCPQNIEISHFGFTSISRLVCME